MLAKQAINDELQGSVAAYLRCGGVVNNQIKKGVLPSLRVQKIWSALYVFISPQHSRSSIKYRKHNIAQNMQTKKENLTALSHTSQ